MVVCKVKYWKKDGRTPRLATVSYIGTNELGTFLRHVGQTRSRERSRAHNCSRPLVKVPSTVSLLTLSTIILAYHEYPSLARWSMPG